MPANVRDQVDGGSDEPEVSGTSNVVNRLASVSTSTPRLRVRNRLAPSFSPTSHMETPVEESLDRGVGFRPPLALVAWRSLPEARDPKPATSETRRCEAPR